MSAPAGADGSVAWLVSGGRASGPSTVTVRDADVELPSESVTVSVGW